MTAGIDALPDLRDSLINLGLIGPVLGRAWTPDRARLQAPINKKAWLIMVTIEIKFRQLLQMREY